ncbi:putative alcohol dehydrogenase cytochrome c subunit [Novosphingobium sp. Rr 2-17]|uniref:c-type cytochrome n=1 Tax=Novosphingobium sp. Rr 2-17 TaxID=555793 RepID=UPI0002698EE4|nr:cytochrome c [Novosphingobium sp. Rr 2-17]EIZ79298.1 putative alcohol dehydrogenase cytochrome c subunit [Novosphingobium sp. Rr 2-17]
MPRRTVTGARGLLAIAAGVAGLATSPSVAQDAPGNKTSLEVAGEGKDLYEQICQACHMPDGKGGTGAGTGVPALAGNPRMADKAFAITTVAAGRGGMPRFAGLLTDAQIAEVLTYVRGHYNNDPIPISEADVKALAGGPVSKSDCNTCAH